MTVRKLAGYAILVLLGVLLFCAPVLAMGWAKAFIVVGAVAGIYGAIFLAVWLIVE